VAVLLAVQVTAPAAANPRFAAVVVDAKSGKVVFSRNADEKRYPASLTKIMTLYLVFEDLKAGRITLDTKLEGVGPCRRASRPPRSASRPGQSVRVEDAIKILITKSANDVAAVVAEAPVGQRAGLCRAHDPQGARTRHDPHHLPQRVRPAAFRPGHHGARHGHAGPAHPARLPRDVPPFLPALLHLRRQAYRNHNGLLGKVSGMDGIKTGFIRASGFNLCASVERNHKRIVAVVMGGRTAASRNNYMANLIEDMFRTAELTRTGRIAAYAGEPPGLDAAKLKLASLPPPLPRGKPQFGEPADEAPVQEVALAAEGSDGDGEMEQVDAASKVSLAATIASFGEDMRTVEADESEKSEVIVAAAAPATETAHETVVKSGWTIQVGAFPSQEGADTRLEQARKSGIGLLSNKPGFTMTRQGSSGTIYRARFSGFTESHAREACKVLKEKNLECLPLAP
jgi:D-alanyl-D-alanine carboxypeptidase